MQKSTIKIIFVNSKLNIKCQSIRYKLRQDTSQYWLCGRNLKFVGLELAASIRHTHLLEKCSDHKNEYEMKMKNNRKNMESLINDKQDTPLSLINNMHEINPTQQYGEYS